MPGPQDDLQSDFSNLTLAARGEGIGVGRDRAQATGEDKTAGERRARPSTPPSVSSPGTRPVYAFLARVIPNWALTTAGPSGWLGLALAIAGSVMIGSADLIGALLVALAILFGGYAVWIAGMIFMIKALLRNHHNWFAGFFTIALVVGLVRFILLLITALSS